MFSQFSNFFFLYYSWLEIKKYEIVLNSRVKQFFLVPIRKSWFIKVSSLLSLGLYVYPKVRVLRFPYFFQNDKILIIHKYKVLENAIFNIVFPFFSNYYAFKSQSFTIYVFYNEFIFSNFSFFRLGKGLLDFNLFYS